ncbi:MAG: HlyD family efflux transporter periplasmic adaptor subunit [Candidatus Levybacteria bacterium]|nr:HlyD family efflux transporter periplasmic adaptor subunit [Candidatus Levybacteria bacterium]
MNRFKTPLNVLKRPFTWFRSTRRRNKVFAVIAVLIIGSVLFNQVQAANAKPQYVTKKVERGTIVQLVSETGNVNTAGRVDVPSTATGIIEELYVDNNDTVAIGQNLFKVRSTASDQEKASANATYQNAVSSYTTAVQSKESLDAAMWLKRQAVLDAKNSDNYQNSNTTNPTTKSDYTELEKQSIDNGVVLAEKDFTAAEKKYKEADIAVRAAQAQVTSSLLSYQATQNVIVKAPSDGTVTNLSFKVGDSVSASGGGGASAAVATGATSVSAASGGSAVLTLANLGDYSIKLAINEVDIPKVKVAQSAEISLDAFSGRSFTGLITHVDQVGTNDQGIVTYNVVLDITDPTDAIRPGMTANVDIAVANARNILTVPNSAIKPYQGKKAVQVVDPQTGEPKYIPVEVGIRSPEKTQILRGVALGTEVITALKNSQVPSDSPFGN